MILHRQRGATLFVSLIMLVVLTLFAVSMIRGANVSLRVVGNFQQQKAVELGMWEQLENFISRSSNFETPAAQPVACINGIDDSCTGGYQVLITAPVCINSGAATGYTKKIGEIPPEDNDWEVTATAVDPLDNSKVFMRMVEGIRVRMLSGSCP